MQPRQYERKEFLYRVGNFFLLLGIGLIILYMFSESARQPNIKYFCSGMVLTILAILIRRRYKRPPPPPSGRGTGFRRWMKNPLGGFRRGGGGKSRKGAPQDVETAEEYEDDEE